MYGTNSFGIPILSVIALLPALAALVIAIYPRSAPRAVHLTAIAASGIDLVLAVVVLLGFQRGTPRFQFIERQTWAPSLGLQYYLGVDGISVLLLFLASLMSFVCIIYAANRETDRLKEFFASILVLETGTIGTFISLDLSLFYVFFELTLIPTALLIGIWGDGPRKARSAMKFFLYTLAGSLVMLAAIISVYAATYGGPTGPTLNYVDLLQLAPNWSLGFQNWIFWGFFFAFAVKSPLFPFHTWLPDAYADAPVIGTVMLSAVMAKMGGYGFLRWLIPLSPEASRNLAFIPIALSIIGILYGGYLALGQRDLKRLLAYSSLAGMGFVVLGIFLLNTQGVQGSVIQMLSHGLISGALFLGAGMIYDRLGTREIPRMGGLATLMGPFATLFVILSLANLGLPGLSAFVSEILVTVGAFQTNGWLAVPVYFYVIVSAAYMLWMVARVFYLGRSTVEFKPQRFSLLRETAPLLGLTLLSVWIGMWASPFLQTTAASVSNLLNYVGTPTQFSSIFGMFRL